MSVDGVAPPTAGPGGPSGVFEVQTGPDGEIIGGPRNMQQLAAQRRVQQTQAQVNEVVDLMKTNVEKVLERDHLLSELELRSDRLEEGASQFEKQAKSLKSKFWLENLKMMIVSGLFGLLFIGILWYKFGGSFGSGSSEAAVPTTPSIEHHTTGAAVSTIVPTSPTPLTTPVVHNTS